MKHRTKQEQLNKSVDRLARRAINAHPADSLPAWCSEHRRIYDARRAQRRWTLGMTALCAAIWLANAYLAIRAFDPVERASQPAQIANNPCLAEALAKAETKTENN